MTVDESFKMPGAVPFKWEIRPGVPKTPTDHRHCRHSSHHRRDQEDKALRRESPLTPQKLKPPSGFRFLPQEEEPQSRFCRSTSRASSERRRVILPVLTKPVCMSPGCIPTSSSLKRRESIRRSTSTRESASPIHGAPLESHPSLSISSPRLSISSYHSYRSPSSPHPAQDADWAGFGLF